MTARIVPFKFQRLSNGAALVWRGGRVVGHAHFVNRLWSIQGTSFSEDEVEWISCTGNPTKHPYRALAELDLDRRLGKRIEWPPR